MHIRFSGVSIAVAVHAQTVHDVDVDNFAVQGVHRELSRLAHGLQEVVLVAAPGTCPAGFRGVYPALALAGAQTDGDILDGSAEARHGMAFKVGQHPLYQESLFPEMQEACPPLGTSVPVCWRTLSEAVPI